MASDGQAPAIGTSRRRQKEHRSAATAADSRLASSPIHDSQIWTPGPAISRRSTTWKVAGPATCDAADTLSNVCHRPRSENGCRQLTCGFSCGTLRRWSAAAAEKWLSGATSAGQSTRQFIHTHFGGLSGEDLSARM